MLEIRKRKVKEFCDISVPGSKSYSHRILIASALSNGPCRVENVLKSEDTLLTMAALRQMGVTIVEEGGRLYMEGASGILKPTEEPIYLGNSGTSMRLLTAVATLGSGRYLLKGTGRMHERPIDDLLNALRQMGISARSINGNGCPPVEVTGENVKGGKVVLDCRASSQYLSALLLIAPYTEEGLEIQISHGPVSKPYIDMTIDVMEKLGVTVNRDAYRSFHVPGRQVYQAGDYAVEPDCSQASYFWGVAAVTGNTVRVRGISKTTRQGDVRFTEVLEKMGCKAAHEPNGIAVTGGPLRGVTVDMADMPDLVPTLAVIAAFAEGKTIVENVAHLKAKESDRLGSVVNELKKMGVESECTENGMTIVGGNAKGAAIDTYDDHRIAMSFAVAGTRVENMVIKDEDCVEKSFPDYWEVFETLFE